jgi:hypothetical protein
MFRPSIASPSIRSRRSTLTSGLAAMVLVATQVFAAGPPGPKPLTPKQLEQAQRNPKGEPVLTQSFSFPAVDTTWFAVTTRQRGQYEVWLSAPHRMSVSSRLEGAEEFIGITFPQRPDGARDVVAVGRGAKGFVFRVFVQWVSTGVGRFERSPESEERLQGVELLKDPVVATQDAYRAISAIDSRCSGGVPAPFAIAAGQAPWVASYTLARGVRLNRLDSAPDAIAPELRELLASLQPFCEMRGWAHGLECVCEDLVGKVNERVAALSLRFEPLETVPISRDGVRFETFALPKRLFECPGDTKTSAHVHRAAGRTWVMVTPAPGRLGRVRPTDMCHEVEEPGDQPSDEREDHEAMRLHVF